MNKGLEINVEIGLCTKEMAKEDTIKDFEILIEEYKEKWSKQMYDYFKECLSEIKKKEKALEIIRNIGILRPYETSGGQCWLETMCDATKITKDNYDLLKEVLL